MLIPTIIVGTLAVALLFVGYLRGERQHISGLKAALSMVIEILPLLIAAFVVAGMTRVLLPRKALSEWIGAESGMRGLLIGTVAGAFIHGGPYVSVPLAAGFLRAGASVGTVIAFITGWSLWAFSRIPMEVGILGWKLTLIRIASAFFFPPIVGLIAQALAQVFLAGPK